MYTSSPRKIFSSNSYAQESRKLPKNWDVRISKNIEKGRPYYVNLETKKSQWNFPGKENTVPRESVNHKSVYHPERVFSEEELADLNKLQDAQHRTY